MVRRGWIYKRCRRCGSQVPKSICAGCGFRALSWVYAVVDVAPAGFSRRRKEMGGFATRKAAQAAMSRGEGG